MGQSLDMLTCQNFQKNKKLDKFTMDRYKAIVKYKTAYYSFHLPVALSMYMVNFYQSIILLHNLRNSMIINIMSFHQSGIYDPERHRQVKYILLEMGHYFQIQVFNKIFTFACY